MLPPIQRRPCDPTGVLALEEERFGFAVLEAEYLAVAADVELALPSVQSSQHSCFELPDICAPCVVALYPRRQLCVPKAISSDSPPSQLQTYLSGVDLLTAKGVVVGPHDGDLSCDTWFAELIIR